MPGRRIYSPAPECDPAEHRSTARQTSAVDEVALEHAARLFRAIGDAARLRILVHLSEGALCVTELAEIEKESLSAVSQRLRILRADNLVVRKRRGKHIDYALSDRHVMELVSNALEHASEHGDLSSGRVQKNEQEGKA